MECRWEGVEAPCERCRAAVAAAIAKMRRPGGSGVARWMPLARWAGWPTGALPTLQRVMWRESRGNPLAVNRSSGCAGLRLYRAAGWQPWGM